jgi:hypothetical protein
MLRSAYPPPGGHPSISLIPPKALVVVDVAEAASPLHWPPRPKSPGSPLIASVGRGFVLRMPTSADYIRGRRGHCAQSRHCRKACSALAICAGNSSMARKAVSYMMPASRTAASTSGIFGRNIAVVRSRRPAASNAPRLGSRLPDATKRALAQIERDRQTKIADLRAAAA